MLKTKAFQDTGTKSGLRFAGIGSRGTPALYLELMTEIGKLIASDGNLLVSGNCQGADQAFQRGANQIDPRLVKLYLPWRSYEKEEIVEGNVIDLQISNLEQELAEKHHPAYKELRK